ncbi:dihydrolipoyllysine-residue succinyltransferase component of 2-oxoglutarate dehydrogenase complex, mitochondrial [Anabrus simplex]|uniref:dihydrolipoyllysine-residue succinyltransferase component of 2-oxoglutarate dehydrogenase complex, mitochondrial n=1 Tax=Anabrus simplex TaxID=316456 RepID=UPI0035A3321B
MAGMLSFSSRGIPRNVLRLTSTIFGAECGRITLHTRSSHQGQVKLSWSGQPERVLSPGLHLKQIIRINLFHSSATLCDESKIITVPQFAESVSEGDVRWQKKVGDSVEEDEVVAEIETDKTSVPVPSPAAGIIEELFAEDGATVKAGANLYKLKITGAAAAKPKAAPAEAAAPPPSAAAPPPPPPPPPPPATAPPTCPAPPPPRPPPSQPSSTHPPPIAAIRHAQSLEAAVVKVPPADPTKEISGTRTEVRVKMNRMRQRIAQRLKEAQNTNAMLTTFNEIDMSNIIEFRKTHLETFQKKHGMKFGFMSAFVKASAYALQDQPVVNAVIDGNEIIYRDYIDISVAVATPKGLVVPVLRNVEGMNYADIELGIAALGEKARKGTLAVEDMDGGTFTISNGGVFGSLMGTPIINPPQSAILGMHAIFDRPVAIKGQVVIRPMMYVALTYDHRLIDGREAVLFLRKIKAAVEDPRIMFLGL